VAPGRTAPDGQSADRVELRVEKIARVVWLSRKKNRHYSRSRLSKSISEHDMAVADGIDITGEPGTLRQER